MAKQLKLEIIVDDKGTAKIKNFGKAMNKSMKDGDKSAKGLSTTLKKGVVPALGLAAAGVTAVTAAIVSSSKVGMQFETTMKRVGAVAQADATQFAALEKAAKDMGSTTEFSATQSAQALTFLSMAGLSVQDSIGALPGMLDLATAAQMDLGTASDIVTDTLTAFGMKTSELTRLSDAFIATSTKSNTTVQMLGESFRYVAPIAANMGFTIEQTSAFLGTLANSGIKASAAGTGLRQVMLKTGKVAKDLGIEGASLNEVLATMKERQFSANQVTEQFGLIASSTATILMNNVDATSQLNQKLNESIGISEKMAKSMRNTAENDWKILTSTIEGLQLKMFETFGPDLRSLFQELTKSLGENGDAFETLAAVASTSLKTIELGVKAASGAMKIFSLLGIRSTKVRQAEAKKLNKIWNDGMKLQKNKIVLIKGESIAWKNLTAKQKISLAAQEKQAKKTASSIKKWWVIEHKDRAVQQNRINVQMAADAKKVLGETTAANRIAAETRAQFFKEEHQKNYQEAKNLQSLLHMLQGDELSLSLKHYKAKATAFKASHESMAADFKMMNTLNATEMAAAEDTYATHLRTQEAAFGSFFATFKTAMGLSVEDTQALLSGDSNSMASAWGDFASNAIRDFNINFVDVIKGDFSSVQSAFETALNNMLQNLISTAAQMVVEWAVGKALSFGASAFDILTAEEGVWDVGKSGVVGSLFPDSSGQPGIPAVVHEGEMIIPADIADGIRTNMGGGVCNLSSDLSGTTIGGVTNSDFMSNIAENFGKQMGLRASAAIGAGTPDVLSSALSQESLAGALTGSITNAISTELGINTDVQGKIGGILGSILGGALAGPPGSAIGKIAGGYLGTAWGDLTNTRDDEALKDFFESAFGFIGGLQAYRDYADNNTSDRTGPIGGREGISGSDTGTGGGYGGGFAGGGYGFSGGGPVNRLMVPRGEDGLAGLKFGEGVVSKNGMDALAKINKGDFGNRPINITVQIGNEEFKAYVSKVADDVRVDANRRNLTTQRIY